jgi:hypothetical protein
MSTSSANPTTPIAMPTLVPVLRLELLEEAITTPGVLLADGGEVVDTRIDVGDTLGAFPLRLFDEDDIEILVEGDCEPAGELGCIFDRSTEPTATIVAPIALTHDISISYDIDGDRVCLALAIAQDVDASWVKSSSLHKVTLK